MAAKYRNLKAKLWLLCQLLQIVFEDATHRTYNVSGAVFSYTLIIDCHGGQYELLRREHASV
jgi:hypothetical protein